MSDKPSLSSLLQLQDLTMEQKGSDGLKTSFVTLTTKGNGASILFGVHGRHPFYRKPEAPSILLSAAPSASRGRNAQDYPHLVHLQIKSETRREYTISLSFLEISNKPLPNILRQ